MVKYHTYTDRTIRYKNRCDKKCFAEYRHEISKRNSEISNLRRSNVDTLNKLKRTVGSYNFIFKQYNDIYSSYEQLSNENQNLKFVNQNVVNNNDIIHKKNQELTEFCNNLENKYSQILEEHDVIKQKYNELLDEYVEDKIEKVLKEDKSI